MNGFTIELTLSSRGNIVMRKMKKYIILLFLSLFVIIVFIGCGSKNNVKDSFDINKFQNEMRAKNYNFQMKDVKKDFLPTIRKRMVIDKEAIDIYLFTNNKKMESEAKFIDKEGWGYDNGSKSVKVDWVSMPHFYKRGNIIVQYVGTNQNIISDLKDILGEQFAGAK